MQAEGLSYDPPHTIAFDRVTHDTQRHRQSNAGTTLIVPVRDHTEESIAETPAAGVGRFEVRFATQPPLRGQGQPDRRRSLAGQASSLRG